MALLRSSTWRTVLVVGLFGGLAALEVHEGLDRLGQVRSRARRDLLDLVDGQQEPLAREVAQRLGDGRSHALHLSRHPLVRELLLDPAPDAAAVEDLGRILGPYVASFAEIDRLRVLDPRGRERFRCERMGGGVATLPAALLTGEPVVELARLGARAARHGVAVSELTVDAGRVEVEPEDRRVFHLAAPVGSGEGPLGAVVVTVYASPLLRALAGFEPLPGTSTCLLDPAGRAFAPLEPPAGSAGEACLRQLDEASSVRERILSGERRIETPEAVLFARATGVEPAAYLVSAVPHGSLAPEGLGSEEARTALRTLLVLATFGLGSAFFVRASQRAARQQESERHAARLRDESRKHRALMDAAADMILVVEQREDAVIDWNPRAGEVFALGAARRRVPLETVVRACGPEGGERLREGLRAAAGGSEQPVSVPALTLRSADGALDVDARCVGIEYADTQLVEVALTDRTRERALERRARQAERLSALGMVTAGVAHEINNPLEGILNYLALLERAEDPARREECLAQVRRGFERIRDLTAELLPLARPVARSGRVELRAVVDRAVSMAGFSRELRGAQVRVEGFDEPLVASGSEGGLEQILLNLLMNAGRAVAGAGTIRIVGRRAPDGCAEVVVEDDGPGIAPEDRERVFDPFFTRSEGTGLGLSVSYQIARAHGGDLSVAEAPGGGARFTLRLPLDDGATEADA